MESYRQTDGVDLSQQQYQIDCLKHKIADRMLSQEGEQAMILLQHVQFLQLPLPHLYSHLGQHGQVKYLLPVI